MTINNSGKRPRGPNLMDINKNEQQIKNDPGDSYRQFCGSVFVPFIFGMLFGIFITIVASHS